MLPSPARGPSQPQWAARAEESPPPAPPALLPPAVSSRECDALPEAPGRFPAMRHRELFLPLPPVLAALGGLAGSGTGEWGRGRGAVEGTAARLAGCGGGGLGGAARGGRRAWGTLAVVRDAPHPLFCSDLP